MYSHDSKDSKIKEQKGKSSNKNMKESLLLAQQKKEEIYEQMKEERFDKILDYLELHPEQTAYSLNKIFKWNIRYINESLKELADSGLIKLEKKIEKNRLKLIASPLTIKDATWDTFREENIKDPAIQKLISKTYANGGSVWIHKENNEVYELRPPKNQ